MASKEKFHESPPNSDARKDDKKSISQKSTQSDRVFTNGERMNLNENDQTSAKKDELENNAFAGVCHCKMNDVGESADRRNNFSDVESENIEKDRACLKYKSCKENSWCCNYYSPSSSGINKPSTSSDPDSFSCHSQPRSSNICLQNSDDADHSSSDTGNDDYSLGSEDGCIYTYRGSQNQNNLLGLIPFPQENIQINRPEERVSPEMDFLEMDFDPGPSCEADSDEEIPDQKIMDSNDLIVQLPNQIEDPQSVNIVNELPLERNIEENTEAPLEPSPRDEIFEQSCPWMTSQICGNILLHKNLKGQHILVRRTRISSPPPYAMMQHTTSGDLICPRLQLRCEGNSSRQPVNESSKTNKLAQSEEEVNLSSALFHCTMAKKLVLEKASTSFMQEPDTSNLEVGGGESSVCEVERTMIWTEREAIDKQVTQIGASACGATAVINVFLALNIPVDIERINVTVGTRQRANNAPLPRYLLSRAAAGCTASDLVRTIITASEGRLFAKFFPTFPEPVVSLSHWLADWITLGAVPILTLNLQKGVPSENGEIADAWHHQMVFGVSPRGVFLCNPMQCVPEGVLWPQLCSESVLLVRNEDVVKRWTDETDLTVLSSVWPDTRWATMNVLGQVVRILRGGSGPVQIPCSYRAGITLATPMSSPAYAALTTKQ